MSMVRLHDLCTISAQRSLRCYVLSTDDQFLCALCFGDKFYETCCVCNTQISDVEMIRALGKSYHTHCFGAHACLVCSRCVVLLTSRCVSPDLAVCAHCRIPFSGNQFVADNGQPICLPCTQRTEKRVAKGARCSGSSLVKFVAHRELLQKQWGRRAKGAGVSYCKRKRSR